MSFASHKEDFESAWRGVADDVTTLYARCRENAPDFGVAREEFAAAIETSARKYLSPDAERESERVDWREEIRRFLNELQADDLYLALACAQGSEAAWWKFDREHRCYVESVARHLASSASRAEEVVEFVYAELYGTRVVEGVRQSKFASYAGRGSLRGWLRAVIWHAVVDAHRASHDEVSIEEWSEAGGEAQERPGKRDARRGGADERAIIGSVARARYGDAAARALEAAFARLSDHEKLLLLLYHVENLKLREIARLVEDERSPLRRWFQRQPKQQRAGNGGGATPRVHESTVMRWLEKVYARVQQNFCEELKERHGLRQEEVEICLELAARDSIADAAGGDARKFLSGES